MSLNVCKCTVSVIDRKTVGEMQLCKEEKKTSASSGDLPGKHHCCESVSDGLLFVKGGGC